MGSLIQANLFDYITEIFEEKLGICEKSQNIPKTPKKARKNDLPNHQT